MCSIKDFLKYLKLIVCLAHLIYHFSFASEADWNKKYDTISFEKARAIFSRPKSKYGDNSERTWKLADREISYLKKQSILPKIYESNKGREMFLYTEITKASERLLSRIEADPYFPVVIDDDSTILGMELNEYNIYFCSRVAREIQYSLLQYGEEVLEIPALANYFTHLKKCGVERVFTDQEARLMLNNLAKSIDVKDKQSFSDPEKAFLLLSGFDEKSKYLTIDPRPKFIEKRKLVTIQPKKSKSPKEIERKPQKFTIPEQKRIIARPKRVTRQTIYNENLPAFPANAITKQLAYKKSAGINILDLIKQESISERFSSIGYEAQLILAWQSVVEAAKLFNEESDYTVQDLPETISASVLYQASPNFSLSNFQNSCIEIILFRNSQIEKGLIDGKQTLFLLKDGGTTITSKHIFKTAAMQLCKMAQEYYLPDIIKNSDRYIDKLNKIEMREEFETYEKPKESSVAEITRPKTTKQRLIDSYRKSLAKRNLIPLISEEDNIWIDLENCNNGNCVNDIVYNDISYWFVPIGSIVSSIFRISSENYSDSLTIYDYTEPIVAKVGNIFETSGETVFEICLKYLEMLSGKGKVELVIGGIHTDMNYLFNELCKEVAIELGKNESFLVNRQSLIGSLYELELVFCGTLGVSPKGRSTDASEYRNEIEMLSSGIIYSGRDIWALEECGSLLPEQLNYLLCFASFANGFMAHLFPKSRESVIPITLFCKAFFSTEKDGKDPFNPTDIGTYLSNSIFESGILEHLPFETNPSENEKKVIVDFFIELCRQFKLNHENSFYVDQLNIADSISRIHSTRLCSAPLFPFLPFEIKIYPIEKDLISSLMQYGFNPSAERVLSRGDTQACLGLKSHVINFLHVLAAVVESFVNRFIDPLKIGTSDVEIQINSLCRWWKHPVKSSFGSVLEHMLPFMSKEIVAEYVLRYSLLTESINFPGQATPEKRIEFIYSTPQISSNRAKDLPIRLIFPEFNPPTDVFLELEYYLLKEVADIYRKTSNDRVLIVKEKLTFEKVSADCNYLEEWQIYLLISFQNTVSIALKTALSRLYINTDFEIDVKDLCEWISTTFPKNFVDGTLINSRAAGEALENTVDGKLPWLLKSMGEYLLSTFFVWAQTAYLLKVGDIKSKFIDKYTMALSDIKKLFDKKLTSIVESIESPKILKMDNVNHVTRLKLNPFVDSSITLPNPELELNCDSLWIANLMIAFRVYFMAFQEKFIEPHSHCEFDPFEMCEVVREIVVNKVQLNEFANVFLRLFKNKRWGRIELISTLLKNASLWIKETFEISGIQTRDVRQYRDSNLLECQVLGFAMENRPITNNKNFDIKDIHPEIIPKFDITKFSVISLNSIAPFLYTKDPVKFYDIDSCFGVSESELRMLVSLCSFLENVTRDIFVSQTNDSSPKKEVFEELQFEFPLSVICKWWLLVKTTNTDPNYSPIKSSWSSLLHKKVHEYYNEIVKNDPELGFPWKSWFTVALAESLLYAFFESVKRNTGSDINSEEYTTDEGFIDQKDIRNYELLESLFSSSTNYKFTAPFHRGLDDLKDLPLTYFSYLHLPEKHYGEISGFLKKTYKRPLSHPEIMVGRVLHQTEINRCVYMAFVMSKLLKTSISNYWRINVNHFLSSFMNYRSSDLSFKSWLDTVKRAHSNTNLTARAAFMSYIGFLKAEARLIKFDSHHDNMREIADSQLSSFYSSRMSKSDFTPNPPKGLFPVFQIENAHEFSDLRIEAKHHLVSPPILGFTRFKGRYWRTKLSVTIRERHLSNISNLIPSIWPSLGKINDPDPSNLPAINSQLKVTSKYNCDGLAVWQINRVTYWTGMLQRYIYKGSRLLKDDKVLIKSIFKDWGIRVKSGKLPKMKNTNASNSTFNLFDMFFFYKVLHYFHNELAEDSSLSLNSGQNNWEGDHKNLPHYTVYLFKTLFGESYANLNYIQIVIFFHELLLEEERIIKLKIKDGSPYTDLEKLAVIYHAPLFNEPKKFVYPGIFFELRSPLPVSWDKAEKLDEIVIPIISKKSNNIDSEENKYYVTGHTRSELPIRDLSFVKKTFIDMTKKSFFLDIFPTEYYSLLSKKMTAIINKNLPLVSFNWNDSRNQRINYGIQHDSMYWEQISHTHTNGLDWFAGFSPIGLTSTFFNSFNFMRSVISEIKKELPAEQAKMVSIQDVSILPDIIFNANSFELLIEGHREDPAEALVHVCKLYFEGTGPISHLIRSAFNSEDFNKVIDRACNASATFWEGNLPLLNASLRTLFFMEFIKRLKQSDARLGEKLIWPNKPSYSTLDWNLFSESFFTPKKLNIHSGFYDYHFFWDPALVLNSIITQAEYKKVYFDMDFTQQVIQEISQTPLTELWSWISPSHSPLYTTNRIFNDETNKKLFLSYIESKVVNIQSVSNVNIDINNFSTMYIYCIRWFKKAKILDNEMNSICLDINNNYGRSALMLYSKAHIFEIVYDSIFSLVERHPHSNNNIHLSMEKVYRTRNSVYNAIKSAIYTSGVPKEINIKSLGYNVNTKVYFDINTNCFSFLQRASVDMLDLLLKRRLMLYSNFFFLNDEVVNSAFTDSLGYLKLKINGRISLNIRTNTTFNDLIQQCKIWVETNYNQISQADTTGKSDAKITKQRSGNGTINLNIHKKEHIVSKICDTFSEVIAQNYKMFSKENIESLHNNIKAELTRSQRTLLNNSLIGWFKVGRVVKSWSRDYSLSVGHTIFNNLIMKLSVKNLGEMSQYSFNDFSRETGIEELSFFFNAEFVTKNAINAAYELGFLLVTEEEVTQTDIIKSGENIDKLSPTEFVERCFNFLYRFERKHSIELIKLNTKSNEKVRVRHGEVFADICRYIYHSNIEMVQNFIESRYARTEAAKNLYSAIMRINAEEHSTSFSFFETGTESNNYPNYF